MSRNHKDLPPGSQAWANELDTALGEIARLTAVVQRLAANAGIDYANPQRGIAKGAMPSVHNPVGQKLSSLADVNTYNVADKQVLSWDGKGQKWLPVTPTGGGAQWEKANDDELLYWDLTGDSDETDTTPQVMGVKQPGGDGGTIDSYGLVGTGDASAFLHSAGRWFGGPVKFHGYVSTQPYYVKMGNWLIDDGPDGGDSGGWDNWGDIEISRGSIYLETPMGEPSHLDSEAGAPQTDGSIALRTNWFYVPQVNGVRDAFWGINWPKRPVPLAGDSNPPPGAMVYDVTLKKHIQWQGTKWVDMLGADIPAALY